MGRDATTGFPAGTVGGALTLPACVYRLMKGEPPEVLAANSTATEAGAFEQRLLVHLRIRNPNHFGLIGTIFVSI